MGFLDFLGGKTTEEKFARDLIAFARRAGSSGWEFVPADRSLRNPAGASISVVNIFLEYSQADRSQRPELIAKYADMMINSEREVPKLWTLAQKAIYPVLRWRDDGSTIEIDRRGTPKTSPHERIALPFHGETIIRIVYDFGPSWIQVTTGMADTWGVPLEEIHARALQNLRALERPRWAQRSPGLWQIESAVAYEESMLLRADVLDALDVRGDMLLLPSNRGVLLAAGSDDAAAIEALLDAAREHQLKSPWPLSTQVLRRCPGGFEAAALENRAATKQSTLKKIELASIYLDQKEALEKWLERTGRDIFVATYVLTEKEDDADTATSYCTWTQGAHSWLPRTDMIALNRDVGREKFDTIFVPWSAASEICGARMRPLDEHPPRIEVADFPDAEEWRRLKDAAQ